mgnify:CR=1 FL=1
MLKKLNIILAAIILHRAVVGIENNLKLLYFKSMDKRKNRKYSNNWNNQNRKNNNHNNSNHNNNHNNNKHNTCSNNIIYNRCVK